MSEFIQLLNSITDVHVLEAMREGLASRAPAAELTWDERNDIYQRIQAIVCRIIQLEP
ncbi:hypothetical protein [Brevibacillus choshinensis]|uniref:Uncharacterized protein n=1 Tax=Brevibacillus choshinensis TaxID=54911 RepID=A0ABX7FL71_BRECH|nr:hypothetical protein [Brevibacillus choshinensis]QRG66444.1 hypothetical protein JNE38_23360 [Brevibacillus choshinensis]